MLSHTVYIRFYGELAAFWRLRTGAGVLPMSSRDGLQSRIRLRPLVFRMWPLTSYCVNRISRDFSYQVQEGDEIRVYPADHPLRDKEAVHLLGSPPALRFVVDSHLGKLARRLRLLGFDTLIRPYSRTRTSFFWLAVSGGSL